MANVDVSGVQTCAVTVWLLDSNEATVALTINPVNDAPVAANDSFATDEDTALTITAPGVLGNDTDVDSPVLTAVVVTGPSHGALTLNANGSFNYTPAAELKRSGRFTYKANEHGRASWRGRGEDAAVAA